MGFSRRLIRRPVRRRERHVLGDRRALRDAEPQAGLLDAGEFDVRAARRHVCAEVERLVHQRLARRLDGDPRQHSRARQERHPGQEDQAHLRPRARRRRARVGPTLRGRIAEITAAAVRPAANIMPTVSIG